MDVMNIEGVKANDAVRGLIRGMGPQPLYDIPGYGPGTLGQLVMYATLRQYDLAIQHAVNMANAMTRDADLLKAMAAVLNQILDGNTGYDSFVELGDYACVRCGDRPTLWEFLTGECEMNPEEFPTGSLTEDITRRQTLVDKIQYNVQSRITQSEFRQVDMQVALNLANTYAATSSNLVKSVLLPSNTTAANLKMR